jgi:quercetin dioxygenase-like cupin family protein
VAAIEQEDPARFFCRALGKCQRPGPALARTLGPDPPVNADRFSRQRSQENEMKETIGKLFSALVTVMCVGAWAGSAWAQSDSAGTLKLPQDIEFKGSATGGPQTAVLYGDPKKPGLYVTRVKFPSGWKDKPHWHPDEARTVAVLSGTLYFARGEQWDESKFKAYPAGTFYSEPAKTPHFTWTKDGEVILQITGIGPSGKTFISATK